MYLDYNSNHPISANYLLSTPSSTEQNKYVLHLKFLAKEMDHLYKVLQDNHYLTQFFQQYNPWEKAKAHPLESL